MWESFLLGIHGARKSRPIYFTDLNPKRLLSGLDLKIPERRPKTWWCFHLKVFDWFYLEQSNPFTIEKIRVQLWQKSATTTHSVSEDDISSARDRNDTHLGSCDHEQENIKSILDGAKKYLCPHGFQFFGFLGLSPGMCVSSMRMRGSWTKPINSHNNDELNIYYVPDAVLDTTEARWQNMAPYP